MAWPNESWDLEPIGNFWDTLHQRFLEKCNQFIVFADIGQRLVQNLVNWSTLPTGL